jgi:predicted transcriptional regulator
VNELVKPREPVDIAFEILSSIEENERTTRWDLTKILGNTRQVYHWIDNFLLKEKFLVEEKEDNATIYLLTNNGRLLLKLLRNGLLIKSVLRLGGRRLRRV